MHHFKPVVTSPNGKERKGKGFSPDEIREAGLTAAEARKLKVPVDWRRQSSHEENIASLKAHIEKA